MNSVATHEHCVISPAGWKPPLVVRALCAGTKSASLRRPSSSCLQGLCPKGPKPSCCAAKSIDRCRTSKYSTSTGASLSMDAAYLQKPPNCGSYFAGDFSNNCSCSAEANWYVCALIARGKLRRTFDRLSVGKIRNRIVTLKGDAVFIPHSSTGAEIPYSQFGPNERVPPASA